MTTHIRYIAQCQATGTLTNSTIQTVRIYQDTDGNYSAESIDNETQASDCLYDLHTILRECGAMDDDAACSLLLDWFAANPDCRMISDLTRLANA